MSLCIVYIICRPIISFFNLIIILKGRHISVKADIAEGVKATNVLGVEDSAVHYLTSESRLTNCSNCIANVLVPVPCPGCIHVVFCSIKCRYYIVQNSSTILLIKIILKRTLYLSMILPYFQKFCLEYVSQV